MGSLDLSAFQLLFAFALQRRDLRLGEHQAFLSGLLLQCRQPQPEGLQLMAQPHRAHAGRD